MSTSNRKYKDSVFVDLFSEDEKAKENFLSLYNALHGTKLTATSQHFNSLALFQEIVQRHNRLNKLCRDSRKGSAFNSVFTHNLCRSEERRVGKECRSRWSPYH